MAQLVDHCGWLMAGALVLFWGGSGYMAWSLWRMARERGSGRVWLLCLLAYPALIMFVVFAYSGICR